MRNQTSTAIYGMLLIWFFQAAVHPAAAQAAGTTIHAVWESLGIGGGGGIFSPAISPHDPNLVFVACDMGGVYRSSDGARSWSMVDGYALRKVFHAPVFHPGDPNIVFAAARGGIKRSQDAGRTWHHLIGGFNPGNPDFAKAIAIDPLRPDVVWAGFDTFLGQKGHYLVYTENGGRSWRRHPGWPHTDKPISKIIFSPLASPQAGQVFLFADGHLYRSDNHGAAWTLKTGSLPPGDGRSDCAAAWNVSDGTGVIFVTRPSQNSGGRFSGGVYTSTDGGDSWKQTLQGLQTEAYAGKLQQYQLLAMSPSNTQIVYVSSRGPGIDPPHHSTLWRSDDGGRRWKAVLFGDPSWRNFNVDPDWLTLELAWGWGGAALGLAVNPNDPQDVICTDQGRAIRSGNGGANWYPISTHRLKPGGEIWQGRGLEVSTAYGYHFDPHQPERTYITYTDFGLTRSLDGGRSWIWAGRGSPWKNTCYDLAFDPDRPGVVYGAWANSHDLPQWKMLVDGRQRLARYKGGLAKSMDHGAAWSPIGGASLPEAPAVSIVLDSGSPALSRTLYAGLFNQGVYKSMDGGRSWIKKNQGLDSRDNMNIWRLDLHPDGTLLCAKTIAYVDGSPVPGGLYRSTDGAETWTQINENQPLQYIFGARMDPRDSNIIYAACFDVPPDGYAALGTLVPWPASEGGGIFKSIDGGRTWKKVLDQPWSCDLSFDPGNPAIIYAATFAGGVYRSTDAGMTWDSIAGLPYVCPQRVTVDPRDPKVIYVATFGGGVWKGRLP